ncbi:MAG: LD-carboxypeptidase [Crocinitomicaceae bacterium]
MKRRQFLVSSSVLTASLAGLSVQSPETQLEKIVPPSLKKGSTIALTAPAGAIFSPKHIEKMTQILEKFGFKVILGKTLTLQEGYLAGSDVERANELNTFFKDKTVNAIFTMRGGWGCGRLLHLIDYELIRQNPKIIMGFSDITSLLVAITKKTGLITFHGPCGYSSWNSFSTKSVYETLITGGKAKFENPDSEKKQLTTIVAGDAKGEILAGNLTVLCSMIGTPFEPVWTGKILCLEEIGEEPYRVDRMLWQLASAGVLNKLNGVVLGSFRKCEPEFPERSFSLDAVLRQHFNHLKIPVFKGASFGHTVNKYNLPIGALAKMNSSTYSFQLLESPTIFNG